MTDKEKYPDLYPLTKGSSFNQLADLLYTLALCRYLDRITLADKNFKLATGPKFKKLAELAYIADNDGVYSISKNGLQFLNERRNCKFLKVPKGEGIKDGLQVGKIVYRTTKMSDFYAILYPDFRFLRPDFAAVFRRGDRAKLVFVEVEKEKDGWDNYLEDKRAKYDRLAGDYEIYSRWWKHCSKELELNFCSPEDFCFSVLCVGDIKKDWRGWQFKKL